MISQLLNIMSPIKLTNPLLLSLLLITMLIIKSLYFTTKKKNFPPSPQKLPLIGNLHQLSSTAPHHSLHYMAMKHGPILHLKLGEVDTLVLSSKDMAREVMKTQDHLFCSRPSLKVPNILLDNGHDVAFAPYGEYWRQMKKVSVLHLLSSKMVQSFRSIREEEVGHLVKHLASSSACGPIDVSKCLRNLAKYVISKVSFGSSSREKGWYDTIDEVLNDASEMMGSFYLGDCFPSSPWLHKVTGVEAKAKNIKKTLDHVIGKIVDEHKASSESECYEPKDFIGVMLSLQNDPYLGKFITKESINVIIEDMFAAGTDSTHIVMDWTMAELIKNPRVMKKLKQEIKATVGEQRSTINEDDLKTMDYLKAVIKESMRLHPPGPLLVAREAIHDTKINGYDVSKGTRILINAWSIGRDANLWESPLEFKPERFIVSPIDFRGQDFELTPFGAGRRICPGIGFAIGLIELGLANLVHQFDWSLPNGMEKEVLDMSEIFGITMRKRTGVKLMATPLFN